MVHELNSTTKLLNQDSNRWFGSLNGDRKKKIYFENQDEKYYNKKGGHELWPQKEPYIWHPIWSWGTGKLR